jgi:hypothetical protein
VKYFCFVIKEYHTRIIQTQILKIANKYFRKATFYALKTTIVIKLSKQPRKGVEGRVTIRIECAIK